mmetsp:Transcript_56411/g.108838  ORF Transcript_56411/g.108838 Transcript_56411/m.108838 type:complete len:105 (-) Transcript_56411:688-1002(-)
MAAGLCLSQESRTIGLEGEDVLDPVNKVLVLRSQQLPDTPKLSLGVGSGLRGLELGGAKTPEEWASFVLASGMILDRKMLRLTPVSGSFASRSEPPQSAVALSE